MAAERRAGRGGLDVYLVRHAVAHRRDPGRWPDDRLRPLTPDGEREFRAAARTLGRLEGEVGAVFSSPLTRAWQTAGILESEGGWPAPEKLPDLAPETPPSGILSALAASLEDRGVQTVALVGHRPSLHELASYMLCGERHAVGMKIKKGGLVMVRFKNGVRPGAAELRGLIPPELLRPDG